MAKLRITGIRRIDVQDDRSVTVYADDDLRGPVEILLDESDARWFWATMDPYVREWREEEDAEED
jgi:hypothetical protein